MQRTSTHVLSRLEGAVTEFAQGRPISSQLVSEFITSQKPVMESVHDVVYMHRLVGAVMKKPLENDIKDHLKNSSKSIIENPKSLSTPHLSVLVSCLADSHAVDKVSRRTLVMDLMDRLSQIEGPIPPRFVSRICKGLIQRKEESEYSKVNDIIAKTEISEIQINDFINIANLCMSKKFAIPEKIMRHGELLVPFMSGDQARRALAIFNKIDANSSIVSELKRNLVRRKPRRAKGLEVESAGLDEAQKAPHFEYVRKIDLR